MKRLLTLAIALLCAAAASAQSSVVGRTSLVDNDTVCIEIVSVRSFDEPWNKAQVNITNKTSRKLTVEYTVKATLPRYDATYRYNLSVTLAPHDAVGDDVLSHYERFHLQHETDSKAEVEAYRLSFPDAQKE